MLKEMGRKRGREEEEEEDEVEGDEEEEAGGRIGGGGSGGGGGRRKRGDRCRGMDSVSTYNVGSILLTYLFSFYHTNKCCLPGLCN